MGALQGREGNGGHPSPMVLLVRDKGTLAALWVREGKDPEPPGTSGPSGGPQGVPAAPTKAPRRGLREKDHQGCPGSRAPLQAHWAGVPPIPLTTLEGPQGS